MAQFRLALPPLRNAASVFAVILVASSVVSAILEQTVGFTFRLVPGAVRSLALWELVTWLFVETTPTGVIFGTLILWMTGASLESMWGRARFIRYTLATTFFIGLCTVGLSYVVPSMGPVRYGGGGVLTSLVWVALGFSIGPRQTNFFGMPVTGFALAGIGAAFTLLNAVMNPWQFFVPELLALALAAGMYRFGGPSDWLRKLRQPKLHSVPERSGRGADKYLH